MNNREVAAWLANLDSNGATDEEFAEFVALAYLIWKTKDPNHELTKEDMQNLDVEDLTDSLKQVMNEIVFSEEMDQSCWWKQKNGGVCYV